MPPPPRRRFDPQAHRPPGKPVGGKRGAVPGRDQGWDPVAAWYDKLVGDAGSDYHRQLILPSALRLLAPAKGESVIDVCCGQGVLARGLLEAGIGAYLGVDASPKLIAAARQRHGGDGRVRFLVADVCESGGLGARRSQDGLERDAPATDQATPRLGARRSRDGLERDAPATVPATTAQGVWADGGKDAAACLMAVHDVRDLDGMMRNVSASLKPGGRAVFVFMHPCFRIPQHTHWGWDNDQKVQFRRVDRYVKPVEIPISTHPGRDSGENTVFFHRPLSEVLGAMGRAGLGVVASEELCSHRRSQSGPFSKAEHRAAEEFPLFLALKAVKFPAAG